jgi:hypothetical protein
MTWTWYRLVVGSPEVVHLRVIVTAPTTSRCRSERSMVSTLQPMRLARVSRLGHASCWALAYRHSSPYRWTARLGTRSSSHVGTTANVVSATTTCVSLGFSSGGVGGIGYGAPVSVKGLRHGDAVVWGLLDVAGPTPLAGE